MIRILNFADIDKNEIFIRKEDKLDIAGTVREILSDVETNGDEALKRYAEKFDGASLASLEVSKEEIEEAFQKVPDDLIRVMKKAKENIAEYHKNQLSQGFEIKREDGSILGQKVTPVKRAGLYVPGGTASYPSTVLMNATPAKIAGVEEIVIVSPPSRGGTIAPVILAAAKIAGVDRIFKTGGAQAIAALAYGTETVPKVDVITGPGNAFVAEAKRQVFGLVDIDMIAGPSEILVIADGNTNPAFAAADLLSQAEHDKMASAVVITDSMELAENVSEEIEKQLKLLPREEIARTSIDNNGMIIVTKNLLEAVEVSNELAPEHLELCVDNPGKYLEYVKNAGSVFMGRYCPEALGDYMAGPNHTLPTGGRAKFSSPLSVDDFVKKTQYIYFEKESLRPLAEDIEVFALAEGLDAHARSAKVRFEGDA